MTTEPVTAEIINEPLRLSIPTNVTNVETVEQLKEVATPYFERANPLCKKAMQIVVSDPEDLAAMDLARKTRLEIRSIRIDAEKTRKDLKEDSFRKGKAIDGIFNGLRDALDFHEKHLKLQETFKERMEEERRAKLKAGRDTALLGLGVDPVAYNTGSMTDETFVAAVDGIKAKIEADRIAEEKAEQERVEADRKLREDQERLRVENDRLQKEAAEREAEATRARAKMAAEAIIEREKREAAERELQQAREAEEARQRAEAEAAEKLTQGSDKKKLLALFDTLDAFQLPAMRSNRGKSVIEIFLGDIKALRVNVEKWK